MEKHVCLAIATKFSHLLDLLQRRVDLESFGNGGTSVGTHEVALKAAKTKGMQKLAVRAYTGGSVTKQACLAIMTEFSHLLD